MCLPEIRKRPNGERIVVSQFGGRRYPPDEEAYILAQVAREEEADKKPQDTNQQH